MCFRIFFNKVASTFLKPVTKWLSFSSIVFHLHYLKNIFYIERTLYESTSFSQGFLNKITGIFRFLIFLQAEGWGLCVFVQMHLSYSGPHSNQSVIGGRRRLISLLLPRRMLWVIRIINTLSGSLQTPAVISNAMSLGISFSYQTLASCLQGSIHAPSRLPTGPAPDTHTHSPRWWRDTSTPWQLPHAHSWCDLPQEN